MLISMSAKKVQPAIAQLEERRFVIGNRSLTTLGPVFESRWLDIFTTSHFFFFFFFSPLLCCPQSGGDEGYLLLLVSCGGDEALGLYDASHLKFVRCKHLEYDVYPGMYGNVWSRVTSRAFV